MIPGLDRPRLIPLEPRQVVLVEGILIFYEAAYCRIRKVPKAEAAWRCASDVFVPVLTATITIIASFLPLLILTGSVGEFIMALPITVAIALAVSFIVAVMLTPLLCRFFIKKGLHDHDAVGTQNHGKEKLSLLDRLQDKYGVWIGIFMNRKWLAFTLGGCAFAFGIALVTLTVLPAVPGVARRASTAADWLATVPHRLRVRYDAGAGEGPW